MRKSKSSPPPLPTAPSTPTRAKVKRASCRRARCYGGGIGTSVRGGEQDGEAAIKPEGLDRTSVTSIVRWQEGRRNSGPCDIRASPAGGQRLWQGKMWGGHQQNLARSGPKSLIFGRPSPTRLGREPPPVMLVAQLCVAWVDAAHGGLPNSSSTTAAHFSNPQHPMSYVSCNFTTRRS